MRYRADELFDFLFSIGCSYEGDRIPIGSGWLTHNQHVFILPDPVVVDGETWLDADTVDAILADRWVWSGQVPLTRHPD